MRDVFICVLCPGQFSVADVKAGNYFPSTGICRECYIQRLRTNRVRDCFGKLYDEQDQVCRHECPDREICRVFRLKLRKGSANVSDKRIA